MRGKIERKREGRKERRGRRDEKPGGIKIK